METKTCTKCGEEKGMTSYLFLKKRNCYESWCRECRTNKVLAWRAKNRERYRKQDREYKQGLSAKYPLSTRLHDMRRSAVAHAKRLGMLCEIRKSNLRDIYKKQNGKCFYTGLPMKLNSNLSRDLLLMSCDRIDSFRGYVPDNVVLCCWGVNLLKGQNSPTHFYESLKMLFDGAVSIGKIKQGPPVS